MTPSADTAAGPLGPPIDVRPLFAGQQAAFVEVLRGLGDDEWALPTVCPGWTVKDVAAHVLGDHVGRLSMLRDGYLALRPRDGEPFPAFIDRLNDEWVTAARRISPPLLVELLASVGDQAAWRLCTRGVGPAEAAEHARIEGDRRPAEAALTIVSIIHSGD